jgi:dethiobiotin synthetase
MAKGIVITGTDTSVGKTYVAERIASILYGKGVDVGVMKPAETGCRRRSGKLIPKDALRLRKAVHTNDALDLVNPYRFSRPLAPLVAAQGERKQIDPRKIINAYCTIAKRHEFMIVEGAGGIMVPLTYRYAYRDLVCALQLPVVIVARPGLGTINHTLLTISALRQKSIAIAGIIINYALPQTTGMAERTSAAIIAEIANVAILGTVHHEEKNLERVVDRLMISLL